MITQNRPLSECCTFEIGGNAAYFAEPQSIDDARSCISWAHAHDLPLLFLGHGSNCLFADRGVQGVVLSTAQMRGLKLQSQDETSAIVTVNAGEPFDEFVQWAVAKGFQGVECLSGIPGSVGAAAVQNIGAYGQEIADCLRSVTLLLPNGEIEERSNIDCAFGYRQSCFKQHPGPLICALTFHLTPGGSCHLRHGELCDHIQDPRDLQAIRDAVLEIRRRKSLCTNMNDGNHRCAGSFFTNPIVSREAAERLLQMDESMPQYPTEGGVKLSAAWLIDHAGFHKGYAQGAVGLSTKHTLAIINRGGAKASDVLAFAALIQRGVKDTFGVTLIPEVNFIGFTPEERASIGL